MRATDWGASAQEAGSVICVCFAAIEVGRVVAYSRCCTHAPSASRRHSLLRKLLEGGGPLGRTGLQAWGSTLANAMVWAAASRRCQYSPMLWDRWRSVERYRGERSRSDSIATKQRTGIGVGACGLGAADPDLWSWGSRQWLSCLSMQHALASQSMLSPVQRAESRLHRPPARAQGHIISS